MHTQRQFFIVRLEPPETFFLVDHMWRGDDHKAYIELFGSMPDRDSLAVHGWVSGRRDPLEIDDR